MKKFLLIFLAFCFVPVVLSADWDDFDNVDRMWDGQKTITDKEFEEVMSALKEKEEKQEEKKEQRQKKKSIKRTVGGGNSLHADMDVNGEIPNFSNTDDKDLGILINTPVDLVIDENILERGFYKVIAERDEESKKIFINFYQSQFLMAKIEAKETDNDFGVDKLDFAEILPYDDSYMKMIFGSLHFNAYAFIPYIE